MPTIAVIGAGTLGGAAAHALAATDVARRVIIVDDHAAAAAGKALDIQQTGPIAGFHTTLAGTSDITRATGCAACIIADPFRGDPHEWTGEEGLAMLRRLIGAAASSPLIFAGASQTTLVEMAIRELGLATRRIVGSAPEALGSIARAMVALEAACSPSQVNLSVAGKPPHRLVVAWNDATIGGHALAERLSQVQLGRLDARVRQAWPPGPYALGAAAAQVAAAAITSSRRSYSVLAALDGLFGVRDGVGVVSAEVSDRGIALRHMPTLSERERVAVMIALGDGESGRNTASR